MGIVNSEQSKGLSLKRKMMKTLTYGAETISLVLVTINMAVMHNLSLVENG
jgi:hypothetical protein